MALSTTAVLCTQLLDPNSLLTVLLTRNKASKPDLLIDFLIHRNSKPGRSVFVVLQEETEQFLAEKTPCAPCIKVLFRRQALVESSSILVKYGMAASRCTVKSRANKWSERRLEILSTNDANQNRVQVAAEGCRTKRKKEMAGWTKSMLVVHFPRGIPQF